jgi:hypothetical protein
MIIVGKDLQEKKGREKKVTWCRGGVAAIAGRSGVRMVEAGVDKKKRRS